MNHLDKKLKMRMLQFYRNEKFQSKIFRCVIVTMVEHAAVNRGVVGSSPTRGVSVLNEENIFYSA